MAEKNNAHRVQIPGYNFVGSNRKFKRGDGVGILIARNLEYRERKDLSLNVPNVESITVEVKTNRDSLLLCALYRPPNSSDRDFSKNYSRLLRKFTSDQLNRLIIGLDHNLDLIKHDKHRRTNEFIEINLDNQLLPTITKPTRITRTTATLIDNIIIGRNFQSDFEACILISDISDHLPCLLTVKKLSLFEKSPTKITTRGLNEHKINTLNDKLSEVNWKEQFHSKDVDQQYHTFQELLTDTIEEVAPYYTKTIPSNRVFKDPWLSTGLHKCIRKQQALYKETIKRPKMEQALTKYKNYRNKLKQIIRKSKEDYYRGKCVEFKRNTSKLWKLIQRLTCKTKDRTSLIDYLKIDNIDYHEHQIMAEEFAKHFANVGKNYASQIPAAKYQTEHYLSKIPLNPKSIFMTPTCPSEIKTIIDSLPNKSSSGHDNISNILLKNLRESLISPLTLLFNNSLKDGVFPHGMKIADVIPVHKNREKYLVTNYRPISLLITISKILEKVVYQRTYNFLSCTDQLYQSQYGFRSGHSCLNAISELVGNILKNSEENKLTIGVFIDLTKAFDTLSHSILLKKLARYGIRGTNLEWFESYLRGRTMRVKIKSLTKPYTYSCYQELSYGTPQGSCLGPLLFLVFINDLHNAVEHGLSLLFADDTTLLHSHKNLRYLKWTVEEDLNKLMDWFRANKLTLNLDKTVCVLFDNQSKPQMVTLEIGTYKLQSSELVKFLGVWIDNKLNWNKHINTLIAKLKQNLQ